MDPFTIALILSTIGQGVSAAAGAGEANENRSLTRDQLGEQGRQFDQQLLQSQANTGLQATQMNPLAQQQSRQRQALAQALLQGYRPSSLQGNQFQGGLSGVLSQGMGQLAPFFSPESRASAEAAFNQTAQAASPQYHMPSSGAVGYPAGTPNINPPPITPSSLLASPQNVQRNTQAPLGRNTLRQPTQQRPTLADRLADLGWGR